MKLHLIYREGSSKGSLQLFAEAAKTLGVEIVDVVSDHFDFSDYDVVGSDDAVYCLSDNMTANLVEKCIIGPKTRTFYQNYQTALWKLDDCDDITAYLTHRTYGLPAIDSIVAITRDKALLGQYADSLGGFPIVIKSLGGQSGHGTMRIDSMESLSSVDDFLADLQGRYILKRYIPHARSVRAVVVGDRVVVATENDIPTGDFRSNTKDKDHHTKRFDISDDQATVAVKAVQTLGLEFGGVDLLIDAKNNAYIAEVNMPCGIVKVSPFSDEPIAEAMIKHLMNKRTAA